MSGKTHAVIGANAAWITSLLGIDMLPVAGLMLIGAFVALLPDVEAPYAKIHTVFGNGFSIFKSTIKHRGLTHSYLAIITMCVIGILFARFDVLLPLVIFLAYLSHLVIDGLNTAPTHYLYPSQKKYWLLPKILRTKVNGLVDSTLFIIGSCGCLLLLLQSTF